MMFDLRSWLQLRRPPDRTAAWLCFVVNQFMTPGLGSLGVGRRVAGTIQLTVSLAGFCLVLLWMVLMLRASLQGLLPAEVLAVHPRLWQAGLALLVAGWLHALVTSLQVLRETRDERTPPPLPPTR